MTKWGTSCFVSRQAAEDYYRPYVQGSPKDLKAAVAEKIMAGHIYIGKPSLKDGERLSVIPGEGRYQIEEG